MTPITGGELLLKTLKLEGIDRIFGVLDGSYNAWLAKLDEYGIDYVCPRHEAAAAHMAEAYARINGKPAVVFGGIGPGASNMISGVVSAWAEGVPLIVLSGQRRRNIIYPERGGNFQTADLLGLYEPVTKWQAGLRDLRRLPELMRKAFRIALSGRPGPVYIEIPEDLMRGTIEDELVTDLWPPERYRPERLGPGQPEAIRRAAEMLMNAQRPTLHAGSGVLWAEAWDEFMALGEYIGATYTTSLAARGVVSEEHPRYFHTLNREAFELMRAEADVALVVGSRLGELDGWGKPPAWSMETSTIQIDVEPANIGLNRPVDVAIVGDAKAALQALLAEIKALGGPKSPPDMSRYEALNQEWREELVEASEFAGDGVNPGAMVAAVREAFSDEAILAQDGGNTSLWFASYAPITRPRSYLYSAHFGFLGTGLPYAIGAKFAQPEREVALVTGDGALGFHMQEMETAIRHGLKLTVVVSSDAGWGMERSSQLLAQVGRFVETEHAPTDYAALARAFGWRGFQVETLEQLRQALAEAKESNKPALIQVTVDPQANLAPPGALIFGSMVYRAED